MKPGVRRALAVCCLAVLAWAADSPALWIDVPFVKQERNACGAASIAMVMQYWQRQQAKPPDPAADASYIQQSLYSEKARGIYASDLARYFGDHSFRTFSFRGEWNDLQQQVRNGRPLIVALKPTSGADLHYVVVVGVDEGRRLVLVNDPAERKLLEREWQKFEREWKSAGNWTLLAVPRASGSSLP